MRAQYNRNIVSTLFNLRVLKRIPHASQNKPPMFILRGHQLIGSPRGILGVLLVEIYWYCN